LEVFNTEYVRLTLTINFQQLIYYVLSLFIFLETRHGRKSQARTTLTRRDEEGKIPQLDQCIMTK